MVKQQRLTYREDGIVFELVKKTKNKSLAQDESKKLRPEYYSRVKHFYDKDGNIEFYGVIKSLKKRSDIVVVKKYKLDDSKFSENIDDRLIEVKQDFLLAKKRLPKVFKDYFKRDMDNNIRTVSLKFTNTKTYYYNISENKVYIGIKYLSHATRRFFRSNLVHELLHCDLDHSFEVREKYGYYSNMLKDKLTTEIMKRVGFRPPNEYDFKVLKEQTLKKIYEEVYSGNSYVIYCTECDYRTYRSRKSKATENIERYRCPICKSKLKVEKL